MKGAIAALEKGMGAFVQMDSSQKGRLEHVVSTSSQLDDFQRESVMDLLQGKQTMQSSGEITGMLKAMQEEMEGDLKSANEAEASAVKNFGDLSAAKNSEISVEIVQTQDDFEDT